MVPWGGGRGFSTEAEVVAPLSLRHPQPCESSFQCPSETTSAAPSSLRVVDARPRGYRPTWFAAYTACAWVKPSPYVDSNCWISPARENPLPSDM